MKDMNEDVSGANHYDFDPYDINNKPKLENLIISNNLIVIDEANYDKFCYIKEIINKHRVKYIHI